MDPIFIFEPGFKVTNPGCDGSGCHTLEDGLVSASVIDLQVAITLNGTTSSVAGELVDANGTVVAVNNSTGNNPFTFTAPAPGYIELMQDLKIDPRWDSVMVNISVTDLGENASNPSLIKLYDNYPNPFNPSTTLRYSLLEASLTSIKIYDAVGKEVAVVVNEMKTAGTHQIEFNAVGLSSGIYYYSIPVVRFSKTKKMILMK